MNARWMIVYVCFIFLVAGCAVNQPLSGPKALKLNPQGPAVTGTTNADRPRQDLSNSL